MKQTKPISRHEIQEMGFAYCPSTPIGELEQFAEAILARVEAAGPDGCDKCRHTYCMSGEVCKSCGDIAIQGWKGGRRKEVVADQSA